MMPSHPSQAPARSSREEDGWEVPSSCDRGGGVPGDTVCSTSEPNAAEKNERMDNDEGGQEEDPPLPRPLCSVLITAIDHVMCDPSPMEPDEFGTVSSTRPLPKVPVIRIFGPIVRRSDCGGNDGATTATTATHNLASTTTTTVVLEPHQSACLHVHEAYPYLVARPRVAGPDGSIHRSSHVKGDGRHRRRLDWDCPHAVQRVLPLLHRALEDAVQAHLQNPFGRSSNSKSGEGVPTATTTIATAPPTACNRPAVVRNVTIAMGRGFYTHCPGPAAPFVQVQYYDPSSRWLVKSVLERGLDVPQTCHPNPRQYRVELDQSNNIAKDNPGVADESDDEDNDDDEAGSPLRFHCYEAHIPYNMQFFKDHNLAGCSYLHVAAGAVRFRRPLPARFQMRWSGQNQPDDAQCFLQTNTPSHLLWEGDTDANGAGSGTIAATAAGEASAAAELDDDGGGDGDESCSSDASIPMAALHQPSQSQSSIASVSAPLFPHFSSSSVPSTDPLVDDDRKLPAVGKRPPPIPPQPRTGPWCHKDTSCSVELDVAAKDILNILDVLKEQTSDDKTTHWRAVPSLRAYWADEERRVAKLLPRTDGGHALRRPGSDGKVRLPGTRPALEGMQRLRRVTPGLDEALHRALRDVVARHEHHVDVADAVVRGRRRTTGGGDPTPDDDEALRALQELSSVLGTSGGAMALSQASQVSVQTLSCSQPSSQGEFPNSTRPDEEDGHGQPPFSESQRLSQESASERSARDRFQGCSQMYYTGGLAAPPTACTQQGESLLEDYEFTQRVDNSEAVVKGEFRHLEDFLDPETLVPFSYDELDDEVGQPADETAETQLECLLQSYAPQPGNDQGQSYSPSSDASFHENLPSPGLGSSDSPPYSFVERSNDSSTDDEVSAAGEVSATTLDNEPENRRIGDDGNTGRALNAPWSHAADVRIEQTLHPPTRHDVLKSARSLLPMQVDRSPPPWMSFSFAYCQVRQPGEYHWYPSVGPSGLNACPVRSAPTNRIVSAWTRRDAKRRRDSQEKSSPSKRIKSSTKAAAPHAHVDENSRRLVFELTSAAQEIEEVEWQPSQHPFSQQPATQDDTPTVAQVENPLSETQGDGMLLTSPTLSRTQTSASCGGSPGTPLRGIGNQGGRLVVEGGGQLKAKTRPSQAAAISEEIQSGQSTTDSVHLKDPVTLMTIEVHVQCRRGEVGPDDKRKIAMTPDSSRDKVSAVVYLLARDPGGGDEIQVLERGCIFVPVEGELSRVNKSKFEVATLVRSVLPSDIMGYSTPPSVECVKDELQLIFRLTSMVRMRDPDMLLSWDTQGAGLGYLIERGIALRNTPRADGGSSDSGLKDLDVVKLLGRTPKRPSDYKTEKTVRLESHQDTSATPHGKDSNGESERRVYKGSGLGTDWDDRVGAGSAAASIVGRLVFAAGKLVAEEVKHPNASYLQAVTSAVLGERIPFHDPIKLTDWYGLNCGRERWRTLHHLFNEAAACMRLLNALDIVGRAGESARLCGVEFSQSFPGIRGSQYKVEGLILRGLQSLNSQERGSKRGRTKLTSSMGSLSSESKSQTQSPWKGRRRGLLFNEKVDSGYFFFSPSFEDTKNQEALEVQALTREPASGHYKDPVVVCDFTALYPSLVIAYNLCYSTICGRLEYHSSRGEMRISGRTTGKVGPFLYPEGRTATVLKHHMKSLGKDGDFSHDRAYVTAKGTVFVAESVVKGVLPQILDELLRTRAMVKKAAAQYKSCVADLAPSILRQLEARQLALKYVANVTYGYTSATFSGRCAMPLLADAIVDAAARTLTGAFRLANEWGQDEKGQWFGAQVIYGDTDSVFVKLPGRSVQEAFRFGKEFCAAVTANNPPPVQLKLEKVYLGSIMQTKKRYCGMKFDSVDQAKPTFEAKGLETVRRDQCVLTQSILRNCLVLLFQRGPEAVKAYLFRQWGLIRSGKLPVSDFILTGRVRSRYKNNSAGPAQASLLKRLTEADPGRVLRHHERISFVFVASPGRAEPLRNLIMTPMEVLEQWDKHTINVEYYINRQVNPALQRCLGLEPHRIDVSQWLAECPKPRRRQHFWPAHRSRSGTPLITSYFGSDVCSLCGRRSKSDGRSKASVCDACRREPLVSGDRASRQLQLVQRKAHAVAQICRACNKCYEGAGTFAPELPKVEGGGVATPLAQCTCIDCPTTYERHRLREAELEAVALNRALGLLD